MAKLDQRVPDEPVSATGGSARSQVEELRERSWARRPVAGFTVAAVAFLIPLTAAVVVVQIVARSVARPRSALGLGIWLLVLVGLASFTMWIVDRASRRLLPIAAMLRLALVFPDGAPSRFAVALKSGSGKALQRSLERASTDTEFATSEQWAVLVVGLISELSAHDRMTRGHSERVRAYADMIGEELGLDPESRSKLHWAALLHDVGKLDVPAAILNKTERLTPAEWHIIRRHPGAAVVWLEPLREWLGEWVLAASEHHERYDGGGYPNGLRGDEISLAGRIVAVADAFDVMTAARSYKKPFPAAQARAELAKNAGTQFDPRVVRALLAISLDRLRLVIGPLAWLSGLSGLFSVGGVASGAAAAVSATVVAASAFAAPAAPPRPHPVVELASGSVSSPPTTSRATGAGTEGGESARASGSGGTAVGHRGPSSRPSGSAERGANGVVPVPAIDPTAPTTVGTGRVPGSAPPGSQLDPPSTNPVPDPTQGTTPGTTPGTAPTTTAPTTTPTTVHAGPVANDDTLTSSKKDIAVDVLANDTEAGGTIDRSSLQIATFPPGGYKSIKVDKGKIKIQVESHTSATLVFTYRICDAAHVCANATVSVSFHNAS